MPNYPDLLIRYCKSLSTSKLKLLDICAVATKPLVVNKRKSKEIENFECCTIPVCPLNRVGEKRANSTYK